MPLLLKPKVCFLAGTLTPGGAERQLFYMLGALRQQGMDPYLLCLTRGEFWEERIRKMGVPIAWVGRSNSRLMRLVRIVVELRKHKPNVVQSQHFYTNSYVACAARLLGLSGIGAIRNDGVNEVRSNGRLMGSFNLRAPNVIAANSRGAIEFAVQQGVPANRLYFLPNAVDTEQFNPAYNCPKSVITLIAVGRLVEHKRFDRFLSVLAQVRKRANIEVKGVIVGTGRDSQDLRPQLERQAADLGLLPNAVEFRGGISNMAPVYQEADICVLTSKHEGTPNVLLEAMASGLPVVSTRVGGVPEIVRQEVTGFMVDLNDEEAMVKALVCLVNDSDLRMKMGASARTYIEQNHSLNLLPMFLMNLYQLALSLVENPLTGRP